jgi:hypothetical protein
MKFGFDRGVLRQRKINFSVCMYVCWGTGGCRVKFNLIFKSLLGHFNAESASLMVDILRGRWVTLGGAGVGGCGWDAKTSDAAITSVKTSLQLHRKKRQTLTTLKSLVFACAQDNRAACWRPAYSQTRGITATVLN